MRADLVEDIVLILQETGFAPGNLNLEVTESTVISDPNAAIAKMARLKSLGVQLSLDDFGTGYSSLTYLHRFPVDSLKVDRSFVSRITQAEEGMEMVRTIVTLAHNLGKAVAAEGIETVEQLALLRSLGVEYGQGFHFSKPLTAESASDFLSNRT
jgi:EAL domain-containing protein (putative c-di-GMP-specific phosphodiesterase class I)